MKVVTLLSPFDSDFVVVVVVRFLQVLAVVGLCLRAHIAIGVCGVDTNRNAMRGLLEFRPTLAGCFVAIYRQSIRRLHDDRGQCYRHRGRFRNHRHHASRSDGVNQKPLCVRVARLVVEHQKPLQCRRPSRYRAQNC